MKSYTYKIYDRADSEIFSQLKKDIAQMYPEFSEKRESKEGDGSLTAFFTCDRTGESIAAELSYANGNIVVTSDICMEKLSEKYSAAARPVKPDTGLIDILHSISLYSPMGIKLIVVPAVLVIIAIVFHMLTGSGVYGYGFFYDLLYPLAVMAVAVLQLCGGIMFIPAAALSLWLAENKRSDAYKLPLAAFLVFAELHAMVFYFYDYAGSAYGALYLFGGAMILVSQLLHIYILLLPLIITDEIAAVKHETVYGKRMSFWQSASYWICTAVVMLAVCIGFFMIDPSDDVYFDEPESRYQYTDEVIPPLLAEYGSHMRTVADYAVSHNYYDWYCCPDESVKESWQALFEDSGRYIFDYELTDRSSCDFRIYVNGGSGEGFWTVGFDDEYIYVNGTVYDTFEEV